MLGKFIAVLLLASLLITHASATEYTVKIGTEYKSGAGWTASYQNLMSPSGTATPPGGFTFTYYLYDPTKDSRVWLKYTPSPAASNDILLNKLDQICLGDSGNNETRCKTDPTNSTTGTVRLTLLDITASTTSSNLNNSNTVNGYVLVSGKNIALIKDDAPIIDVMKIKQETGVTYTKTTSEVIVRFEYGRPIGITVKAESREPKQSEWGSNYIKYTIDSSGTYTFTVKYKTTNPSQYEEEITETYGLKLINLGDGASTTGGVTKYKSTVYIPDTLSVNMGTAGSFTQTGGVTITPQSGTEHRLAFDSEGVYTLKYTTTGGTVVDDAVVATVRKAVQATPRATEEEPATEDELTGNQQQGEGGSNWWLWGGISVAAIVLIGYMLTRKKSGGGTYVNPD